MAKRLKSLNDCRRFLARIINETYSGELDPNLLGKLSHATNVLIGCIQESDIEKRIRELEGRDEAKKS